jgi:ATP-dependent RNA helicase DDX10/DBP4
MSLYGKQKQAKRVAIFNDFSKKKEAYLFATDIAARGLDFPAVDWVIQVDCPEDVDTYIHRVGRTARYNRGGKGMLLLLPTENPMVDALEKKGIKMLETNIASEKMKPIAPLYGHLP